MRLRIGHSQEPDDAFMAWALAEGVVRDPAFTVDVTARDIGSLNQAAQSGKGCDVSVLSVPAFADVTDEYLLLPFGASFGEGHGPVVVASEPMDARALGDVRIAVPDEGTTAATLLRLALGPKATFHAVPPEDVLPGVKHGLFDAGLIVEEGVTFEREGLVKVLDLWEWWSRKEPDLPLPLGVMAVREDVGDDLLPRAVSLVRRAIDTALENRDAALAYAARFTRNLTAEDAARFVDLYVNPLARDMRPRGEKAIARLIERMVDAGLVEKGARVRFAPEPEDPHPETLAATEARAPVDQLQEILEARGDAAAPVKAPARKATRKTAAKRTTATGKTAKKATSKKSAAKKTTRKSAAAGKAAKKATSKKPPAKKTARKATKKTAAKKTTRKSAATKATKKATSRKSTRRK